jgi:hypothetical protein
MRYEKRKTTVAGIIWRENGILQEAEVVKRPVTVVTTPLMTPAIIATAEKCLLSGTQA